MKQMLVATFLVATVTSLVWPQEPIRERIEWADIWVTDADKNDMPRVLLVGDSITRGYFDGVEKRLAGKAYCARLTTSKCAADPSFLDEVRLMLKQYRFTVIHFNNGLHGFGYTEERYRAGLSALLDTLTGNAGDAKLIWATTTPVRVQGNLGQIAETTERVKTRSGYHDQRHPRRLPGSTGDQRRFAVRLLAGVPDGGDANVAGQRT